jgi:hypothetical protein
VLVHLGQYCADLQVKFALVPVFMKKIAYDHLSLLRALVRVNRCLIILKCCSRSLRERFIGSLLDGCEFGIEAGYSLLEGGNAGVYLTHALVAAGHIVL